MSNRETIVASLANDILKQASEEILSSPLAKTASEEDLTTCVADKIAGMCDDAVCIYKQAAESLETAADQEDLARQALVENGINPDHVIAAAEEAAAEAITEQADGEDDEDEDDTEE